jgi:DNA-directed RNA polymerase subunit RPC12/RpoP
MTDDILRIVCPSCGSKLNAKPKLVGQTRSCPKCGQPILIAAHAVDDMPSLPVDEPAEGQFGLVNNKTALASRRLLDKLDRHNRYWILDRTHLLALWSNDGQGWQLKTPTGMVNAARNRDKISTIGNFVLVELKMEQTDAGHKLAGLTVYSMPSRWALSPIAEGDDRVCGKIEGRGSLNKEQKAVIRLALREHFMHDMWGGATAVLEFLNNADYHSHGTE